MLTKKERLTKKEFDRSFSLGKRVHSPYYQLIIDKTPVFHGAVVVGKKVCKKAVDRNTIRRSLYGVLYRFAKQYTPTMTIIVVAKPSVRELSSQDRRKELQEVLMKLV